MEDLLVLLAKMFYKNKQFFSDTTVTLEGNKSFQMLQLLQKEANPFT